MYEHIMFNIHRMTYALLVYTFEMIYVSHMRKAIKDFNPRVRVR